MRQALNVVVIGGSGFIGRSLVRKLRTDTRNITVVSRSGGFSDGMKDQYGVLYRRGDVADATRMSEVVAGADVVFHLAASFGQTWADFNRVIVEGARNVGRACLDHRVKRLIFTSSIAALYLGKRRLINESSGTDQHPERRSLYSRAKIQAEHVLVDLHKKSGLPVVIVRPGVVMGRGGMLTHSGVGLWANETSCLGWGAGDSPLPVVLVQDVAEALVLAMNCPSIHGECFNLVGDVRITASDFVRILAQRSLRPYRFFPQSLYKMQLIEVGKWLAKRAARVPENPFPGFRDLKSRSFASAFDCSAAKNKLGWHPNGSLDIFLSEVVDSQLKPVLDGDLRVPHAIRSA